MPPSRSRPTPRAAAFAWAPASLEAPAPWPATAVDCSFLEEGDRLALDDEIACKSAEELLERFVPRALPPPAATLPAMPGRWIYRGQGNAEGHLIPAAVRIFPRPTP